MEILQANGQLAQQLNNGGGLLDPGKMKPYLNEKGEPKISVYVGSPSGDRKEKSNYRILQTNSAVLRRDEWIALDQAVLKASQSRLVGIQDLRTMGLVYALGNAMGTTVLESHKQSTAHTAVRSMTGKSRGINDQIEYLSNYTPVPITHVDYELNLRQLESSRRFGNPIDTENAVLAARAVADSLEAMLFTNTTYVFGNGTLYSYINLSGRETLSMGTAWDATGSSALTGKEIVEQVSAAKAKLLVNKKYGPYVLYIPTSYETKMDEDYDTSGQSTQTIRERILKLENIKAVKVADQLPDDNVVLVQMTSDVVRLIDGMGIQNIEWGSEGGMVKNYKVLTIQVPELRTEFNGKSGIVHISL